ncbi:glycosyltransferase [Candidatus Saccharibacteria bacterium]|nr:glycosyltransferase [Candidatus Saccharibacteria bacterium]
MNRKDTTKRIGKFAIIGIILALFNFVIYTFLARVIMNSNELLWLDSIIAYLLAAILAYILHSKITWKERYPGQFGVIKFLLWNGITAIIISPLFTWLFQLITPLYKFIFNISTTLNLPFDYNFIESTGVFILTTCVTMILNYLFYDKLVFGQKPTSSHNTIIGNPKISIVIPIYNTEKYLPSCLNSIINQSYQNLEIILVDDGSKDNSGKIADDYAKKDKRIKVIHQKNAGQSAARNAGLAKAHGDYVSFIDSDDEVALNFYEEHLKTFGKNTSVTVCGAHYKFLKKEMARDVYIDPLRPRRKHESKKAYILYLLAIDGRIYWSVNKLFRTNIAKKCVFDESLNFAEDTKFVLDYLKKSNGEVSFVLKPLYIYNFGTETSTIRSTATVWKNWQRSYKDLKTWLGPHPTLKEEFWLHTVHLRWRVSYVRSKRRAKKYA